MMNELFEQSENYERIEQAIQFISTHFKEQPGLDEIAASVNLSRYHFQRLFKRWAGVTPTQFTRYLTVEYAKEKLREAHSILETSLDAGLSGPSRLHDLFVTYEAVTPGDYKKRGADLNIQYGIHPTPFGTCLIGLTKRGICILRFIPVGGTGNALVSLKQDWPLAQFSQDQSSTMPIIQALFAPLLQEKDRAFHLLLRGTNFQVQVWRALLAIPPGAMVSYQDVANQIAVPTAVRAVANAVARNPISYIIPCHRVISKAGYMHHYRWGDTRKKAMLGWEASHSQS